MPIIDHATVRLAPTMERVRERYLVSKDLGAVSLTVKEVEISPGWEGRMHTHPVDVSIQVLSGAIQVILGDEVKTVRAGTTLLAPPGVPHKLIHHLWTQPCC
jgi:quercetin dioxygenase-like cupin family protein